MPWRILRSPPGLRRPLVLVYQWTPKPCLASSQKARRFFWQLLPNIQQPKMLLGMTCPWAGLKKVARSGTDVVNNIAQETNRLKKVDCALLDRAKICYIFGIFITRCNFFWRGDKISPPRFRENHYFFRGEGSNFQKSSLVSIIIVSDPINRMAFSDFKNSKYLLSYGQLKLHLFTIIILIFP